jgi:putative oxidoreductase
MMKQISTLGRVLFALPFAIFGINHIVMQDFYLGMLTSFLPFGAYIIIITGLIMIATSLSIIFKKFVQTSSWTLAVLLFLFIATIHIPNLFDTDINTQQMAMVAGLKDISLLGGAILIGKVCKDEKEKIKKSN